MGEYSMCAARERLRYYQTSGVVGFWKATDADALSLGLRRDQLPGPNARSWRQYGDRRVYRQRNGTLEGSVQAAWLAANDRSVRRLKELIA